MNKKPGKNYGSCGTSTAAKKGPAFFTDCRRLSEGLPLGYIIGWVPFLDTKIYLDSQPLIPRSETEYWTDRAIAAIQKQVSRTSHILDLCAGSGCIGVATLKAVPTTQVDFVEIDQAHLKTIAKNLKTNRCKSSNYRLIHSDLFIQVTGQYDFILANPPYLKPSLESAEPAVKAHEPTLALSGGPDGFDLLKRIITAAPRYLKPHGQLWLEHEPQQSAAVWDLGRRVGFKVTGHEDQYRSERYSVLMLL